MTNRLYICINKKGGRACVGQDSRAVFRALRERVKARGLDVVVQRLTCMGYCSDGPNVKIHGGSVLNRVTVDDVDRILDACVLEPTGSATGSATGPGR